MGSLILYYSVSGQARRVAERISERTGIAMRVIELVRPYSFVGTLTRGIADVKKGRLPELKGTIDLSDVDVLYLGGPTWGWDLDPVLKRFLMQYDVGGKTIVPFCSDQGEPGRLFDTLKEMAEGATVKEGHEFVYPKRKKEPDLDNEVAAWLSRIGMP